MKTLIFLFLLFSLQLSSQCDNDSTFLPSFGDFATSQQLVNNGIIIPGDSTIMICYQFVTEVPYSGFFLLSFFTPTNQVNYIVDVYDVDCNLIFSGQEFLYDATYQEIYTVCYTITTSGQAPTVKVLPYFIYFQPLAVKWGGLEARQHGQGIRVAFITLSEINVNYFEVQMSKDLIEWNSLLRLLSKGNVSTLTEYETYLPYRESIKQVVYVRVEEVDFNGTKTQSNPVPVLLIIDSAVLDRLGGFDLSGRKIK